MSARHVRGERHIALGVAVFALAGAASGVLAKVADELRVDGLSDLGTSPTLWILVLALIARLAPSPLVAAGRGTAFYVALCVGYYAWTSLVLRYPGSGPLLAAWLVLALTVVPVVAALVRWARDRLDPIAASVIAGVAGLAANDPSVVQLWYATNGELPPDFPLRPTQAIISIVAVALITLWVPTRRAGRAWTVLLLVPATIVVGWVLEIGRGLVPG